jgi:hypothetical protein
MKKIPLDLYNRHQLFIGMASCVYKVGDKDRFQRINTLIDRLLDVASTEELKTLLMEFIPKNARWFNYYLESLDAYRIMHVRLQPKTKLKNHIRLIKASVKLYYKIDEVLNRVDVLGIAYMLRISEYDIYTERITADIASPKLSSVPKIKKFIIYNLVEGNSAELDDYGYWGDISNVQYVPVLVLSDEDSGNTTESDEDSSYWIDNPRRGRGPARVRLEDRIHWGSEKIFALINKYKKAYSSFYTY